jgi:hypothetical protein
MLAQGSGADGGGEMGACANSLREICGNIPAAAEPRMLRCMARLGVPVKPRGAWLKGAQARVPVLLEFAGRCGQGSAWGEICRPFGWDVLGNWSEGVDRGWR